jgi:hypothetical protein
MERISLLDMMNLSYAIPSVLFKISVAGSKYAGQVKAIKVGGKQAGKGRFYYAPYSMQSEFSRIELLPDQYEIEDIIDTKSEPAGKVLIELFETENKLNRLDGNYSNSLLNEYFKEWKWGFEKLREYHAELKLEKPLRYINEIIEETELRKLLDKMKWEETLTIKINETKVYYSVVSMLEQNHL